jgi:hypothetical protein
MLQFHPGLTGDVSFRLGDGAEYCGSTVGGFPGPNNPRKFSVRRSPPPTACPQIACP